MKKLSKVYKELSPMWSCFGLLKFQDPTHPKKGPFQYPIESLSRPRPRPQRTFQYQQSYQDPGTMLVSNSPRAYGTVRKSPSNQEKQELQKTSRKKIDKN